MFKRKAKAPTPEVKPLTQEELKDKGITMYFENEEEMEGYIKYHNIKNFEYAGHQPRTIIFPANEVLKEIKEK